MDLIKTEDFLGKYPNINNVVGFPQLNPYTDDFYQALYSKKEFNELILEPNEPVPEKKGNLFKRQKIITRFLSSYTPYDSLLLFHSMGSGKCLHPDTMLKVYTSNGKGNGVIPGKIYYHKISELWDIYNSGIITFSDEGFWMKPKEKIEILCMTNKGEITYGEIVNLYKEHVDTQLIRINLEGSISLTKTMNHMVFTFNGWHKDILPGMYIKYVDEKEKGEDNPSEDKFRTDWKKVISVEHVNYKGFVYDLEVEKYHTYIANSLVTHNTCSAFGTTEKIREEDDIRESNGENRVFKGVIVITRRVLIRDLINKLLFECSRGDTYIPENYEELTDREKVHRINKKVGKYYSFHTFFTFAKSIKEKSDKHIRNLYSNHIIIIDEVHNIRKKEEDMTDTDIKFTYEQIHRFLHGISNSKILLMSGTPMKDTPEEISLIMNLILPNNLQLPRGKKFIEDFMENNDKGIPVIRKNVVPDLKKYFRGNVSYLSLIETVSKEYMKNEEFPDSSLYGIKTFTLYIQNMSKFQTKGYLTAYESDNKGNYYINSREASLFVFPDGSSGEAGFKTLKKETQTKNKKGRTVNKVSYTLSNEIKKPLNNDVENLRKFSDKYYFVVKNLLDNPGRNSFIYTSFVKGSGAILLSLILRYFGFTDSKGNDDTKARRFAILTKDTTTDKQTIDILNLFNSDKNYRGEYIQTIIGSRIAGEGLSFKNIQDIYILTPHWNYSETSQAIYRGIREGSHKALIQNYIIPDIKIYQMVSKPLGDVFCVDEYLYTVSAKKDISIKSVERVIKEASFDCQLTKRVNMGIGNEDFSRECDYLPCEYKCDGIVDVSPQLDYSTYNLYYDSSDIKKLKSGINEIFKNKFNENLEKLRLLKGRENEGKEKREGGGNDDLFITLTTLNQIINYPLYITDKYGFKSYLKEKDNNYFLVNGITNTADKYLDFYSKNPINKICRKFGDILNKLEVEKTLKIIPEIINNVNNAGKLLRNVSIKVREIFLEICFLMRARGIPTNKVFVDKILDDLYGNYINKVDSTYISSLMYNQTGKHRCLRDISLDWEKCHEDIIKKRREILEAEEEERVMTAEYDYVGLEINPNDTLFRIANVAAEREAREDARRRGVRMKQSKKQTGRVCNPSISKVDLVKIIINIGGLSYKPFIDFVNSHSPYSINDIINLLRKSNDGKKCLDQGIIPDKSSKKDLLTALFWIGRNKAETCGLLRTWFRENGQMKIIPADDEKTRRKILG